MRTVQTQEIEFDVGRSSLARGFDTQSRGGRHHLDQVQIGGFDKRTQHIHGVVITQLPWKWAPPAGVCHTVSDQKGGLLCRMWRPTTVSI